MFLPGKGNRTEIHRCFSIPSFTWTRFKWVLLCVCDLNLSSPCFQMERFEMPGLDLCAAPQCLPWVGDTFLPHTDLLSTQVDKVKVYAKKNSPAPSSSNQYLLQNCIPEEMKNYKLCYVMSKPEETELLNPAAPAKAQWNLTHRLSGFIFYHPPWHFLLGHHFA